MSDEASRTPDDSRNVPLERPRHLRPPISRRLAYLACAAATVGGLSLAKQRVDCEHVALTGAPSTVAFVCQGEYQRTRDPMTGVRLAYALDYSHNYADAKLVATG